MIAMLVGHTLRLRSRSNLIWAAGMLVWSIVIVAIYPSISHVNYEELLKAYPKEVLKAFGMEDAAAFSTPIGYLNGELFSLVFPWAIVFLPLGVLNHCLPAAEERHFLDNLLCTPVGRWQVVAGATLAAAASLAIVLVLLWAGTIVSAELIGVNLGYSDLARSCFALFPLASLIASFGALVAGARGGRGMTLGFAGGVLVLMYMLPVIAAFEDSFEEIQKISVFYYYNDWLSNGIVWGQAGLVLVVAAALTAVGALLFERRDIAS
ncbi:MAG: ABC transporter permease subunit [Actinobacteria bacterium]|nr:ABC transporter permease subunit [Actinomycetota bacterium]